MKPLERGLNKEVFLVIDNNIIVSLESGTYLTVCMEDDTILGGVVQTMFYVEEMGDTGFHLIYLAIDGRVINLDSRKIKKVLYCATEDGRNSLENYGIEPDLTDTQLMKTVIDKWKEFDDTAKDNICNVIACSMNKELLKDIIGAYVNLKCENKRLSELRLKELDNQIDFLNKYGEFKKYLPDGFGKLYDTLIFDTFGIKIG